MFSICLVFVYVPILQNFLVELPFGEKQSLWHCFLEGKDKRKEECLQL